MWEHSQDFLVPCFMRTRSAIVNIIFLYAPPCCQDVSYKKCWRTPPMGVGWSPRSQLIKQDWYKYCSVLRTSGLLLLFRQIYIYIYLYLLHLFDRYFIWVDKHIFWYRLIDLRNSKNPTYAHTHTTHQTSLPSCQQFLGELNQSLGLEPFRINQNPPTPAAQGGARKGKGFSDTALVAFFSILYPPAPTLKDELVPKPRQKTA